MDPLSDQAALVTVATMVATRADGSGWTVFGSGNAPEDETLQIGQELTLLGSPHLLLDLVLLCSETRGFRV